jgi:hypothetical protein
MAAKWARLRNMAQGMNRPINRREMARRVLRIPRSRARK